MTDSTPTPREAADRVSLWLDQWRPDRHQTYSLARTDLQALIDHALATTPGDDRVPELGERPDRMTPRDELTGRFRAVSEVLDDYLMREYGRVTSHNGWDLLLDLLAEQGYEVRALAAPTATEAGDEAPPLWWSPTGGLILRRSLGGLSALIEGTDGVRGMVDTEALNDAVPLTPAARRAAPASPQAESGGA